MATSTTERHEVHFSGRVQGVGFRYTVHSLARRFDVSGFVRNLSDGRVQVVVEGTPEEVRAFLGAIQADMGHYIRSVQDETSPTTGRLRGFEVRF